MQVYYIDNLTDEIMCMDHAALSEYEKKTLVWVRESH